MGINKKGGKKFKKKKNIQTKNIMVFKECIEEQYAKVTKMLGNCNIEAKLLDNTTQFCVIPGSMKKKKWIKVGDIILIAIREYQHSKADVLFVYSQNMQVVMFQMVKKLLIQCNKTYCQCQILIFYLRLY